MYSRRRCTSRLFSRGLLQSLLLILSVASLFSLAKAQSSAQAQNSDTSQASFTLKVNSDIVLTNVIVRDKKTGEVVTGLKPSDFTVLENGKPKHILTLDFENVDDLARQGEGVVSGTSGSKVSTPLRFTRTVNLRNFPSRAVLVERKAIS